MVRNVYPPHNYMYGVERSFIATAHALETQPVVVRAAPSRGVFGRRLY